MREGYVIITFVHTSTKHGYHPQASTLIVVVGASNPNEDLHLTIQRRSASDERANHIREYAIGSVILLSAYLEQQSDTDSCRSHIFGRQTNRCIIVQKCCHFDGMDCRVQ